MYHIEYSKTALRALRKIPRNVADTILKKLLLLATDPYAHHANATKLQGREGYRLRVGDWRVLYDIHKGRLTVLVLDVRPRGGAYQ
jgi:mRNA interferase RelE/StbE